MSKFGFRRDATIKVRNLLRLVEALRRQEHGLPFAITPFAEANDCSSRTVRRDLKLLEAEGWVHHDAKMHSFSLTPAAGQFSAVMLSAEDAVSLALARTLLFAASPPLAESASLRRAFDRVLASLPRSLREQAGYATRTIRQRDAPPALPDDNAAKRGAKSLPEGLRDTTPRCADTLSSIVSAATEQITLHILYESLSGDEQKRWRGLDPYEIEQDVVNPGKLYLHGWCHNNNEIRTFALERIHEARRLPQVFTRRENEWEAFVTAQGVVGGLRGGAPVAVEIRFTPDAARYALRQRWPDGLTIAADADGGARLTGVALGTAGMVRETLRWRRHARVVGGPELLAAMREELGALARLYDDAQ